MPGGGIARRPLHVVLLADCSGSMAGPNIQALNFAVSEMVQHFAAWDREQDKSILIRALSFATEPAWHIREPLPAAQMRWKPLTAVKGGRTNMAPAFRMVAEELSAGLGSRGLRPVIVLVTDGLPTDTEVEFDEGIAALMAVPASREALRIAVAIGNGARSSALTKFIGNSNLPVLVAEDVSEISDQLYRASLWVTHPNLRSSGSGDVDGPAEGPLIDDVVI